MNRQERLKWELIIPVLERLLAPPPVTPLVPCGAEIARIQKAWAGLPIVANNPPAYPIEEHTPNG